MEPNDFKKLLDEQAKTIEANIDQKIDAAVKQITSESKAYTDAAVKQIAANSTEHTERYLGAMSEDYQHKLKAVAEYTKPIGEMRNDVAEIKETTRRTEEKLDATFERTGELSVDMTITQQTVKNHEERIAVLEKA